MSIPSTFPSTYSIPSSCFYNMTGLSTWLNQNPTYKEYFINYPNVFPELLPMTSTLSTMQYNVQKVPLQPYVTMLSQQQSMLYSKQMNLFRRVYAFNSNAYVTSLITNVAPIYYRFLSNQELMNYKASVGLVNKLYPFDAMANGRNEAGSTLQWIVPFPL